MYAISRAVVYLGKSSQLAAHLGGLGLLLLPLADELIVKGEFSEYVSHSSSDTSASTCHATCTHTHTHTQKSTGSFGANSLCMNCTNVMTYQGLQLQRSF